MDSIVQLLAPLLKSLISVVFAKDPASLVLNLRIFTYGGHSSILLLLAS